MEIDFALIADYATNTSDGKLVVAGIFDSLYVQELPASHPSMALALRLRAHVGEEGRHQVRVRLVDPDGRDVIEPLDAPVELQTPDPAEGGSADLVLQMVGLRFSEFGRHSFDVLVDGRFERGAALTVRQAPAAPGPAAEGSG